MKKRLKFYWDNKEVIGILALLMSALTMLLIIINNAIEYVL